MAYLDSENVSDLVAAIKELADDDYLAKIAVVVTTANENINNYTDAGVWYFSSSYTPSGKPSGSSGFGFLVVLNGNSTARLAQFWIDTGNTNNAVYFRSNASSSISWNDWKKVLTNADVSTKQVQVTIASTLPSGITAIGDVTVVQSGNVVSVSIGITRDSTNITSFGNGQIATGLPIPAVIPKSGSVVIPFGEITVADTTWGRPLLCTVTSGGALQVRYGARAGTYNGSFTYITNDIL